MMRRRSREEGLSLIEVLVAMAVFAIGALGVLGMTTTTLHLNLNSRQITDATILGSRQLEQMQLVGLGASEFSSCGTRCWLNPTGLVPSTSAMTIRPADVLGGAAGSNASYQVTWRVQSTGGMTYIHVVVHWPKSRDLSGTDWTSQLDCFATPQSCYSVQFHSYRN